MLLSFKLPPDRERPTGTDRRSREREQHFENLFMRSWREMRSRSTEPASND
jgi:hypothetical protein